MTPSRSSLAAGLMAVGLSVAPAAASQSASASGPAWSGSVRCEIDIQGTGYSSHETHTWTITGPPAPGNIPEYPGMWTVTGTGSVKPTKDRQTSAEWKTNGSAPGVRMVIFVRGQDRRLVVLLRHGQLSAPAGTTMRQQATTTVPVSEWRPFPDIQDVESATRLTGSATIPVGRTNALQSADAKGQAACTWDLVQGSGGAATPSAVRPAAAAPAPSANTTRPPDVAPRITPAPLPASGSAGGGAATGGAPTSRAPTGGAPTDGAATSVAKPPTGPSGCATASSKTLNLSRGQSTDVNGAIKTAGSTDWLLVHFAPGASVRLTIGNAAPATDASDFQVLAFSDCSSLIVMTTGTGTKTLDFPDSGPHDVIVRIGANPWKAATPTYTLKLEAR